MLNCNDALALQKVYITGGKSCLSEHEKREDTIALVGKWRPEAVVCVVQVRYRYEAGVRVNIRACS